MGRRFPRIRGDVPAMIRQIQSESGFSPHTRGCSVADGASGAVHPVFPHTRGCSGHGERRQFAVHVFPAYAGMFRLRCGLYPARSSFPRIPGDVPASAEDIADAERFPRIRGDVPEARPAMRKILLK